MQRFIEYLFDTLEIDGPKIQILTHAGKYKMPKK